MVNDLSKDFFNCPHCGINNVQYERLGKFHELIDVGDEFSKDLKDEWCHYVIKCPREECKRVTYIKVRERSFDISRGWLDYNEREVEIQWPSIDSSLPDYIPGMVKKYYKEAIDANNFGLKSSASIMCRKVIYEICDKQKVSGKDYKEKINNLGFDKRITDPLLNIKNIGDETVHADGWDQATVEKAIEALGIIIDKIYIQEARIKQFSNHYSKTKKSRANPASVKL